MLTLRPYQQAMLAEANRMVTAGTTRPQLVAATGLGKTVMFAADLTAFHQANPRARSVILLGRDELAEQARDKLHGQAPHLRPGIVMGTRNDYDRPVVIASAATVGREDKHGRSKRREAIHSVGRIIVDESHHVHEGAPTWLRSVEYWGALAGVPTLGFTATPKPSKLWQDIVRRPDGGLYDTEWGIRNGYLCDVRGIRVQVPQLDLSGVHMRAGDLDKGELAGQMLDANTGSAIVRYIHDILTPRFGQRRGTVFCPNVATAEDFAAQMNAAGIPTGVILGTTPKDVRRRIYLAFERGELQWLCNAMVLTEGWDAPWCDAIIIARLTKVKELFQQIVGRGLRLFPGKTECIVGDVCGVTDLHDLAGMGDLAGGEVKPRDGQSLLEALDEFDLEDNLDNGRAAWEPAPPPVHRVIGTDVDLFGHSRSVWLRTGKGLWFIPAGAVLVFLWPQPDGHYSICRTLKNGYPHQAPDVIQTDVTLEIGMALAEQFAEQYDPTTAGKDAAWRQKGPIRPGQKADLEAWGIERTPRMTAAQAYDAICTAIASSRLDWAVA